MRGNTTGPACPSVMAVTAGGRYSQAMFADPQSCAAIDHQVAIFANRAGTSQAQPEGCGNRHVILGLTPRKFSGPATTVTATVAAPAQFCGDEPK